MIAANIFAKDANKFMSVYNEVTSQRYGNITVDCHPLTPSDKQVVSNIVGDCKYYPLISSSIPQTTETPPLDDRLPPLSTPKSVKFTTTYDHNSATKSSKNPILC